MRVVLLCGGQHNQVALAHKVADAFDLVGIIIEQRPTKKATSFSVKQLMEKILNRTVFISLHKAWFGLLEYYKKRYPFFPATETIKVATINSDATINFIKKIRPDLLMISGTSLVRKKILELNIPLGIINLHTGLSPYIKGGPNCTNWCISKKKFHLIGNTIMWIDAGIDSGDIITTEITTLEGGESISELHIKVMDHAHELYLRALKKIDSDLANCPKVKQLSIASGTTYYNKEWSWKAKWDAIKNFKKMKNYVASSQYQKDKDAVITISI